MSLADKKDFENFVHYEKKYVATYKELILTFLAFCIILFVLYPKDLLKDQILSEASNYDLSMLYLKNMLDNDPENESLMIILAEQSLRSGKRDLSFRLLELLYDSDDYKIRKKSYLLSYTLAKEDYFFLEGEAERKEQMLKTVALFYRVMDHDYYNLNDIDKWYEEAIFVKSDTWTYFFLKEKIKIDNRNIDLLEKGYFLSIKLKKRKDTINYLHQLQDCDKDRKTKWIMAEYYLALDNEKYIQAEMVLKRYAEKSLYFKEELAKFYNSRRAYLKASNIYMDIYDKKTKYLLKREYFFKALNSLQAGGYTSQAVKLAKRYENRYINDRKVRVYLLKMYIAAGKLKDASALAKKLLHKR